MADRLKDRIALVTGASQGIGEAIVRRFVQEGAKVVGISRNKETLGNLAASLNGFTPFVADVQDHDALARCVDQTIERYSKIDILINNAGFQYTVKFLDSTLEEWRHMHRVNLEAQFVLCHLVVPHMVRRRYGRIVNVSSTQSIAAESAVSGYASTKGGINAFTRALAVDLAEYNILANVLAPGAVRTPMSIIDGVDGLETETFKEWYVRQRKIPLARPGEASEIAAAALFLASEECSYMTGQMLVVDGGLTITF